MADRPHYHHGELPDALRAEALRLVRAHGVHGFSLRAAARGVGVDVAAVYRHFRDKGALLRDVARQGFLDLAAAMAAESTAAAMAAESTAAAMAAESTAAAMAAESTAAAMAAESTAAAMAAESTAAAMAAESPAAAMAAERAAAEAGASEARFLAVGRAYVRFAVAEPELFRLMFGPHGAGGPEPLFGEGRSVAFAELIDALEALHAAGACARPVPEAAIAAWATVHGLATLLVDGPLPRQEADARTEVVLAVVLAGLRPR